jgi:hypothetical protein
LNGLIQSNAAQTTQTVYDPPKNACDSRNQLIDHNTEAQEITTGCISIPQETQDKHCSRAPTLLLNFIFVNANQLRDDCWARPTMTRVNGWQ